MRRLLLLALLAACKSKGASVPAGPPAVARCEYHSKTVGENHACFEIYDASRVAAYEKFCGQLKGARDHGEFTRGAGCPADGRKSGCLESDGSIVWVYEGHHTCFGQEFKGDSPPAHGAAQPYHCTSTGACQEYWSVFDLTPTVTKSNCEGASQGAWAAGPCPLDKSVGRCESPDTGMIVKTFYYPPATTEQAKAACSSGGDATFTGP